MNKDDAGPFDHLNGCAMDRVIDACGGAIVEQLGYVGVELADSKGDASKICSILSRHVIAALDELERENLIKPPSAEES